MSPALGADSAALHLPSTPKTVVRGVIAVDRQPVLRIHDGQTVVIDTVSHAGLTDDPVKFFAEAGIPKSAVLQDVIDIAAVPRTEGFGVHVLTGPIYIDGAEPGDMLEVRIHKITPRVAYGVNNPGPGGVDPTLVAERTSKVIKFDLARNVGRYPSGIEVPLSPFMGTMAVAPAAQDGQVSSRAPGNFGGNLDFAALKQGATLYLPVLAPGALFYTGDSHAGQGDGEVDGNAIEASMTATLQFIVHKGAGKAMRYPAAEDQENYYAFGMDRDLNVALKNAVHEAVVFMQGKGMSVSDAYSVASVAVNFGIAEAVDGNLVTYGRIPKSVLPTKVDYWTPK
jgi:acetamidase/formamidase